MMIVDGKVNYAKHEDGYSVITLDRANKRNAINQKMVTDFKACLKEAREDEGTFLVVTGKGDTMFCAGGDLVEFHGDLPPDEDRKSTRLNSSHVAISYAVFCLKKKTHSIQRQGR